MAVVYFLPADSFIKDSIGDRYSAQPSEGFQLKFSSHLRKSLGCLIPVRSYSKTLIKNLSAVLLDTMANREVQIDFKPVSDSKSVIEARSQDFKGASVIINQ